MPATSNPKKQATAIQGQRPALMELRMTVTVCVTMFAPLIAGCMLAAIVDVGCRIHGGSATPTPAVDYLALIRRKALKMTSKVSA